MDTMDMPPIIMDTQINEILTHAFSNGKLLMTPSKVSLNFQAIISLRCIQKFILSCIKIDINIFSTPYKHINIKKCLFLGDTAKETPEFEINFGRIKT